ncbi:glycoside hydrolase family 17 protein [Amanita rubescens]|nr:glycoside hydrolase family 17 protein [Amanita rubescens]
MDSFRHSDDFTTGIGGTSANGHTHHHWNFRDVHATTGMGSTSSATPLNDTNFSDSNSDRAMSPYDAYDKPSIASKRKRCVVFSTFIAVLIIGAIIGVAIGVPLSKKKTQNDTAASGPSGSSSNGGGKPPKTSNSDPSVFPKDPNLHQSFYGMAYTPDGSQLPNCGNSLEAVIKDIQIMSQLTKRVRLYGADCNQSALVLEAIRRTKVDMQVYLGNYNVPDDNDAAYDRQKADIQNVIQNYGADHVSGITVGNEYILNYVLQNGGGSANGPAGDQGAALLVPNIDDTRTMIQDMNLNIPIGNADAGAYFNDKVLAAVDYGMANVHPWFGGVAIDDAAQWTLTFFQNTNVDQANQVPNKPQMSIAETGWPTKSSDPATATDGPSEASVENLQKFLDTFICQANQAGVQYFFFELFDEVWKNQQFGGVEGWWGLFNYDRTMKAITIPKCPSP